MSILPVGTTSFAELGSLRDWFASLRDVTIRQTPSQTCHGEPIGPWRIELVCQQVDPAYVLHPGQSIVVDGEGRVEFEVREKAYVDSVAVTDGPSGPRLTVVSSDGSVHICETRALRIEVAAHGEQEKGWVVPTRGRGAHELRDLTCLRWFECIHAWSVLGTKGEGEAREVLIKVMQRQEDEGEWHGRLSAESCTLDFDLEQGSEPIDGGTVDEVHLWEQDRRLQMQIVLHDGALVLEGPVIRLVLQEFRPYDD